MPNEAAVSVESGEYTFERNSEELFRAAYAPENLVLEVFENPKAVRAFNEAFGGIFAGTEIAWMKDELKSLQFMAEFLDREGRIRLSDFSARLAKANQLFMEE